MGFAQVVGGTRYLFEDLRTLMARATPFRSGDALAGVAAASAAERVAAQRALAELPLKHFLAEVVIPYEADEVTRLISDRHDAAPSHPSPTSPSAASATGCWGGGHRRARRPRARADAGDGGGRQQDLPAAGPRLDRREVPRRHALPQHDRPAGHAVDPPAAERPGGRPEGRAAQILDGLLLGAGDAVIGVNPATDNVDNLCRLLAMLDALRERFAIPTQSCVLAHVTTTLMAMERGAPVDLVFQSIGGHGRARTAASASPSPAEGSAGGALSLKRGHGSART
jgi:ethanolamine ammonia-lyase large subunit